MKRLQLDPRPDWQAKLAELGMELEASAASPYWREDAAYCFDGDEIETLHEAADELIGMIEAATDHVVRNDRFAELGIPGGIAELAARSWHEREPSLYGRFDFRFDGDGAPKLLEYNADTPTALFEASVVQWHWLEERFSGSDQYNSIHEGLIGLWNDWRRAGRFGRVHFACVPEDDDDLLTTAYLQDTAVQAGLDGLLIPLDEVGWNGRSFVDLAEARIEAMFKLYPWDWLAGDDFFPQLKASRVRMLEPAWRVVPSSKGILAVLWELFPGHPNLLPAAIDAARLDGPVVVKPLLGREGANVQLPDNAASDGPYANMATVAQAFAPLPAFEGWHPVIGVWTVGREPRGLGVREDRSLVTGRGARFVPHMIAA